MTNVPDQKRGGFNQGEQTLVDLQIRYAGQPAIKCGAGDTILFQNSPVVSGNARGKDHPRAVNAAPLGISGMLCNLTVGTITFDVVIIDDEDNEFSMAGRAGNPALFSIAAGEVRPLFALFIASGLICLPVGWTVVLRVLTGSTATGRGLVAWPWSHDMAHNTVPVVLPLTTTLQEVGPAVGRGWQLASNALNLGMAQGTAGFHPLVYANFDTVARSVAAEYFHLADEDILSPAIADAGPIGPIPPGSGVEEGFRTSTASGIFNPPFILCYPDTLKVRASENQTTGPLYMFATFTEFDLPEDLG